MGQQDTVDLEYDFNDEEFDLGELDIIEDELTLFSMETDEELDDLFNELQSDEKNNKDDLSNGPAHRSLPPDWKDFDYG